MDTAFLLCRAGGGKNCVREGMDAERAEAYGYIHDIGRMFGGMQIRHIFEGYHFLKQEGYESAARICLTHSFPVQSASSVTGIWDCSDADELFLQEYLPSIQYDQYDQLIQICDVLGSAQGITVMEKRMVDIVLRYGIDAEHLLERWRVLFQLQKRFEEKLGCSIYKKLSLKVMQEEKEIFTIFSMEQQFLPTSLLRRLYRA